MNILVSGGLGYIGSHICVELLNAGHNVIVIDNLSNSKKEVSEKIKQITGKSINLNVFDLCNEDKTNEVFKSNKIDTVIHCAGLKAVGESIEKPLEYYKNNLNSTFSLLTAMKNNNVKNFIFSSSATVYANAKTMPITEDSPLGVTNPYGRTKLMIEKILTDFSVANPEFKIIILRYFNPVGAHSSYLLGENPNGVPNNLVPFIQKVSCGKLPCLKIFGKDYATVDGTGVRDYIHVVDLALGHIKALDYINKMKDKIDIFNLGTGNGVSVLQMVSAYEKVCNKKIPVEFVSRRGGDIAECYCSPAKANKILNWKAERDLNTMCQSAYNFENNSNK